MKEALNFLPISRKVHDVYISIGEKGDKIQKEIKCFNCVSLLHQIKNYIALYCVGYFEKLSCAPQKRHLKREKERPYWGIEWKICSCLSSPKTSFWTGVWRADLYLYSTVHLFLDLTINCRVLYVQYTQLSLSTLHSRPKLQRGKEKGYWYGRCVLFGTTDCLALKDKRIGILRFYIYCFYCYIEKSNLTKGL